jgi:hypothetical protein
MTLPIKKIGDQLREELLNKIEETQQQLETPIKIDKRKPVQSEGVEGERKIIKEGIDFYQYRKIENQWYKVKLEKA